MKEGVVSRYHLAQINIAALKAPIDSPELKDFVANLERINSLAESTEGFVWRLLGDGSDATGMRPFGPDTLVNMSVWRDVDSLRNFVFKSAHTPIMKRRREWFARMAETYTCMWWVPSGHTPTVQEARQRLERIREHGSTPESFHFGEAFPPPDAEQGQPVSFTDNCPA